MDVLVFLGSPRKKGNSEILTEALLEGVKLEGGIPEIIRLCDHDINPCISCGGCDDSGKCVVDDGMTPFYKKILEVDRIILASPIFFYGITAQAKSFIDRMQALWNRKRLLMKKGEWVNNPERKGFFVSVAATSGERIFEGAILTMKYGFDAMDVQYVGEFLVSGPDKKGDMFENEAKLEEARQAGRNFMLGHDGHVD
jgi:multimeric flavodoxin WrbA